jgi:hypothetical protein
VRVRRLGPHLFLGADACDLEGTVDGGDAELLRFPDGDARSLDAVVAAAPRGAVVALGPGRFHASLVLDRAITLRGCGELTRLVGVGVGATVRVELEGDERVVLESLALSGAHERRALEVAGGRVELNNVVLLDGAASDGGALRVLGGAVEGTRVRIERSRAERGGAAAVVGEASLALSDASISRCEAGLGGALYAEGGVVVALRGTEIERVRATRQASGQVMALVSVGRHEPRVWLQRVCFRDAPSGHPVALEGHARAHVTVVGCELPRQLREVPGVTEYGQGTRWR